MINIIKTNFRKIWKILIIYLILINASLASNYSEIEVSGNNRISVETVIMFSGLNYTK